MNCMCKYLLECIDELFSRTGIMAIMSIKQRKEKPNKPFLVHFPGPLYQNKVECSAFDVEMIFHSHAQKTHFHKNGCALGLNLKVRVFGTPKWPIEPRIHGQYIALQHIHQH